MTASENIQKAMDLIGSTVKCVITQVEGIVTSSYILESGIIQVHMSYNANEEVKGSFLDEGMYTQVDVPKIKRPPLTYKEDFYIGDRVGCLDRDFEGVIKELAFSIGGCVYANVRSVNLRSQDGKLLKDTVLISSLKRLAPSTTSRAATKAAEQRTGSNPFDRRPE